MRYQGGKRRSAKYIAPVLARMSAAAPVRDIGDLFLGSAGIEIACSTLAPVTLGAEICAAVVACYRAVADGWDPPARLTREEYAEAMLAFGPDSDHPMAAFALLFCSYGGKWRSGFLPNDARCGDRESAHAAAKARKDLLALRPILQRMTLVCEDYRAAAERVPDGGVLYLDPPWRGTTGYRQAPPFDVDAFWTRAAAASTRWRVIVSEGPKGPPVGDERWALAWSRTVGQKDRVLVVPTRGSRSRRVPRRDCAADAFAYRPLTSIFIPQRLAIVDNTCGVPPMFPRLPGAPETT